MTPDPPGPPAGVTVEEADVGEAEAVAGLWVALAAGQRDHGSHLLPEANRQRVRDTVARHVVTGGLLVARAEGGDAAREDRDDGRAAAANEGDILGFVMFSPESGSYEQDVERGTVENLYVREGHRGAGVGSALLAAAEAELRAEGADAVALEVMADNGAARRFYRRHGYRPHRMQLEKRLESDTHSRDDR